MLQAVSTMANEEESPGNVRLQSAKLFEKSLRVTVPGENVEPSVAACSGKFGDYQCNNAMGLYGKIKGKNTEFKNPNSLGQAIARNLPLSEMVASHSVAGPGFVNIVLSNAWLAESIQKMLVDGIQTWAPELCIKLVAVDCPDRATAEHVTIICDTLARMLRFSNVEVLQINNADDWKTHASKLTGWRPFNDNICIPSHVRSGHVFKQLLTHPKAARVGSLLILKDDAAGTSLYVNLPFEPEDPSIYGYGADKFAKLKDNVHTKRAFNAVKVFTDKGFKVVEWRPYNDNTFPKATLVGLGRVIAGLLPSNDNTSPIATLVGLELLLKNDTTVVKLDDLRRDAKAWCMDQLVNRGKHKGWSYEELERTAEAIGYGAVMHANLKSNIVTDHTFNLHKMLDDKGDTAIYSLYAHARICEIIQNSKDIEELKKVGEITLDEADERTLGLHLLQFSETVEDACTNLSPSVLCQYLYNLSKHFSKFYENCQVNGSPKETSRLLLCEATAVVMRKCFELLGITPVYKI